MSFIIAIFHHWLKFLEKLWKKFIQGSYFSISFFFLTTLTVSCIFLIGGTTVLFSSNLLTYVSCFILLLSHHISAGQYFRPMNNYENYYLSSAFAKLKKRLYRKMTDEWMWMRACECVHDTDNTHVRAKHRYPFTVYKN